jgi:hypothetical protein
MRDCLDLGDAPHARFSLQIEPGANDARKLIIRLDKPAFGPQPWFCTALEDGQVHHDNLDFGLDGRSWSYTFDEQTVPFARVRKIGLATNTLNGRTSVMTLDTGTGKTQEAFLN